MNQNRIKHLKNYMIRKKIFKLSTTFMRILIGLVKYNQIFPLYKDSILMSLFVMIFKFILSLRICHQVMPINVIFKI